jgi:hypothetical protein
MRGIFFLPISMLVFSSVLATEMPIAKPVETLLERYADGLLVKFKSRINQRQALKIAQFYGATELLPLSGSNELAENSMMAQWWHLRFGRGVDLQKMIQRIKQSADVDAVELNGLIVIQGKD